MIPFSAWSQNKIDTVNGVCPSPLEDDEETEFSIELGFLLDAMLENVVTSSSLQLRRMHVAMEEGRMTKLRHEQEMQVAKVLLQIEDRTTDAVAQVLLPVLSQLQMSKVIDEFASVLKKVLPEFADQTLLVKAPANTHATLAAALHREALSVNIEAHDGPNIFVDGENVVLRAELDRWCETLVKEFAA
jgi:hypothetical protein